MNIISDRYHDNSKLLQQLRASFRSDGYIKLSGFLKTSVFRAVSAEAIRLHANRIRKDFVMSEFDTDRKMSIISGKDIIQQSDVIANLYACQQLRDWISSVAGVDIHTVTHDNEFLVLNFLDGVRDTHGWHLDDPRYALIVVVESPAADIGGQIQYVPNWKRLAQEEGFDPRNDVERGIDICKHKGKIFSDDLESNDCYLLDAAEVLHRVSPMSSDGKRKALNMAFDDRRYRVYGETATKLYA